MAFKQKHLLFFPSAPNLPRRSAESPPARSQRPTTTALCPATVTDPGLRGRPAIQLEDSAPADSTSSGVSAQSVLRDTTASPTADVSQAPRERSSLCGLLVDVSSNASSLPSAACECGRRLCDEVTGKCICPPQTVRPSCDVCQAQTFSYHPLLGCDGCECAPTGIKDVARPDCDRLTGQCKCVKARQCVRVASGSE